MLNEPGTRISAFEGCARFCVLDEPGTRIPPFEGCASLVCWMNQEAEYRRLSRINQEPVCRRSTSVCLYCLGTTVSRVRVTMS